MKTLFFSFIALLMFTGCSNKNVVVQKPLEIGEGSRGQAELKNEIRDRLGLPKPTVAVLQDGRKITVPRPNTPERQEEKIMRGLMLSYTDGGLKWGGSYVYDVLLEKRWSHESNTVDNENSVMIGGIN